MPREIKFRIWDGTKIVTPVYIRYGIAHYFTEDGVEAITNQIMQYTDLKDKNGKEIYEGDLIQVKSSTDSGGVYEIIWDNGEYRFRSNGMLFYDARIMKTEFANLEVVGNIHENLETLNKK